MNSFSSRPVDVVIVGGGIIGLLSARLLAQQGLRVRLLEAGSIGTQSSWAGGGILSPLCPWRAPEPVTALCSLSQTLYPQLAAALFEETHIDPEWTRSGLVFVDSAEIADGLAWCEQKAVDARVLPPEDLHALEPSLTRAGATSLWLPSIAQIRNPRLLQSVRASLVKREVELIELQQVTGFETSEGRVTAARTEKGWHPAERFVVAAGAWTAKLLTGLGSTLPIAPVKGQMLAYAAPPGLLSHIVVSGDRYLIPRRDGVILAGSTVETVGFDKTTTEDAREQLASFAEHLLPPLRDAKILRHWAGLRPGSPSGIPYIGRHPQLHNLVLCAGHFRNGFVMAPASCQLLADLLLDRPTALPPEPYALDAAH